MLVRIHNVPMEPREGSEAEVEEDQFCMVGGAGPPPGTPRGVNGVMGGEYGHPEGIMGTWGGCGHSKGGMETPQDTIKG